MQKRTEKLSMALKNSGDAFLITSDTNRRYITGFSSSAGAVFITYEYAYLLVDFRYGEAAEKAVKNAKVIVYSNFADSIKTLCKKHGINKIFLENQGISLSDANRYKKIFSSFDVKTGMDKTLDKLLTNMRMIKSRAEINRIKEAQKITEESYCEVLNYIKPGVLERDIALELEFKMRKRGASGVSFDLITITGKKTSLPHGVPDDTAVCEGDFFLMDIGAVFDGYHSDMTRTVAVCSITEEQERIYDIVLNAQLAGINAVKAGVTGDFADNAARNVIKKAGYGEFFGHSTGHGVGLEIHEEPRLTPKDDTILSSGMVVTVEPGIYLPGKFGVRIEDMVCVTQNGCTNLTSAEKKLIIV